VVAEEAVAPAVVVVLDRAEWADRKRPVPAATVKHVAGQPCYNRQCPKCGTQMVRE
jgi:hypothetical protein